MSDDIRTQLEELFTTPATPKAPLAIMWMDTAWRLASILLNRKNANREKGTPEFVPSMADMHNSLQYIGSFDTYFGMIEEDASGKPIYPQNKAGLGSIAFGMYQDLTSALMNHAEELKGIKMQETALGIIKERRGDGIYLPDVSGPSMEDFAQPIASKVCYYSWTLMKILRANGGAMYFPAKSNATRSDVVNLKDIVLVTDEEQKAENLEEYDHLDQDWDIFDGKQLRPENQFVLEGVDLEEATQLKQAFDAWMAVYEHIGDNYSALDEEVEYQVERTRQWVEENRKHDVGPVSGTTQG